MKLPVIRHLNKNHSTQELEATIAVLETFSEHRLVSEQEMDMVGELLTNLCGAVEVHGLRDSGMEERDAANTFAQKVLGSIDR